MKNTSARIRSICVIRVLLLFFVFVTASLKAAAQENFTVMNYFTDHYRDFPMMKISIIPPAGFVKDTTEPGFINSNDNASIRAIEIKKNVDSAFADFFFGIDSTGRQGKYTLGIIHAGSAPMELLEVYDFTINGFSAHLLKVFEYTEGEKYFVWTLFIGDAETAYMINGYLPKRKQQELDRQIRSSLLSAFYEPQRRIIPPGVDPTTTGSSACSCHNKK
jgi:hypothetical protein